jgi:hypothetical protein
MPNAEEKAQTWLRPALVASWGEIAAVLIVLVAPFALPSSQAALYILSERRLFSSFISDPEMLADAVIEASLLGVLLIYLHWRGWKTADLRIRPGLGATIQGILLAPLQWISSSITWFGAAAVVLYLTGNRLLVFHLLGLTKSSVLVPDNLSWTVFLWTDLLNAFFEEITYLSYAFNQLAAKRGPRFAMAITLLMRMSCHTYHGPIYIWGNMAVFLVGTLWYWRTRNVWPIIVGHGFLDIGLDLHIFSIRALLHLVGFGR